MGEGRDTTSYLVNFILGGWMGSGIAILIVMVVDRLFGYLGSEPGLVALFSVNFFPQLTGGMVTTFLLTKRSRRNYEIAGMEVGLSSFLINLIISFRINLYILIGYMLGGYFGAKIAKKRFGNI